MAFKPLTPLQSKEISFDVHHVGDSLWFCTDFNKGERGMVEYDLKSDKVINVINYPKQIQPIPYSSIMYKQQTIFIIDYKNNKIIAFNVQNKSFSESAVVPFNPLNDSIFVAPYIHIFSSIRQKHTIFNVETRKAVTKDGDLDRNCIYESVTTYQGQILRFGGCDAQTYQGTDAFYIGTLSKSGNGDIAWSPKPQWKLPIAAFDVGHIVYRQKLIIFGGCMDGNDDKNVDNYSDSIYVLDLSNDNYQWQKMMYLKCPMKCGYVATLVDNNVHLFPWGVLAKKAQHFVISISQILPKQTGLGDDGDIDDVKELEFVKERNVSLKALVDELTAKQAQSHDRIRQLEQENKALREELQKLKVLDTSKYLQWTPDDVVTWIISLDGGMYKEYEAVLRKSLVKQGVNGERLREVRMSNIREYGVNDVKHRAKLFHHIQNLLSNR